MATSEPQPSPWFVISQMDYLGIQFDPAHRSGFWETMLARRGAQRVETPGYSIFVFHLGERFSKNAAIPSAASAEANARN